MTWTAEDTAAAAAAWTEETNKIPEIKTHAQYEAALTSLEEACHRWKQVEHDLSVPTDWTDLALLFRIQVFEVLTGLPLTTIPNNEVVRATNSTTTLN